MLQWPCQSESRDRAKAALEHELQNLKSALTAKRRTYSALVQDNDVRSSTARELEARLEVLRIRKRTLLSSAETPATRKRAQRESEEMQTTLRQDLEAVEKLEAHCHSASLALTNTIHNLDLKIQEIWRIFRRLADLKRIAEEELSGGEAAAVLCGNCLEMLGRKQTSRLGSTSTVPKGSTEASERYRSSLMAGDACVSCAVI